MKKQEEHSSINALDDVMKTIDSNSKRTSSGCLIYCIRGTPTSRITVRGKQIRLKRLYYLFKTGRKDNLCGHRLLRKSICTNKHCIEPSHQHIVQPSLKVFVTSFDPVTYKDFTCTVRLTSNGMVV